MSLRDILAVAHEALQPGFFIEWNVFLATVPLVLAWLLFRRNRPTGPLALAWWSGLVLLVLFLPNAAYTATDLVHLVRKLRRPPLVPLWAAVVFVLPQFALYVGYGLLSYVLSLRLLGTYLRRQGLAGLILPAEVLLHAVCGVAIYLGFFVRLNSWHVLTHPGAVLGGVRDLLGVVPVLVVAGTGLGVAAGYYPLKYVLDLVIERRQMLDSLRLYGLELGLDRVGNLHLHRKR